MSTLLTDLTFFALACHRFPATVLVSLAILVAFGTFQTFSRVRLAKASMVRITAIMRRAADLVVTRTSSTSQRTDFNVFVDQIHDLLLFA